MLIVLPHRAIGILQMLMLIYLISRVGSVEISRINLKVGKILRHQLHAGLRARVVMSIVELVRVLVQLLLLLRPWWWMILACRITIVACCLLW